MTLPRGTAACRAQVSTVQCAVCWNRTSGPPFPVDSRLMNAPMLSAHLLLVAKPCEAWNMRCNACILNGRARQCGVASDLQLP
jgi:hypothetical protein